jgi:hypothetical protein
MFLNVVSDASTVLDWFLDMHVGAAIASIPSKYYE